MRKDCQPGHERMVRWLSPSGLFSTGMAVVLGETFGTYSDKRELEGLLPRTRVMPHGSDGQEFWFDFVADVGDGWDSTYSIAWLLGQESFEIDCRDYVRGDLLVMGGDEVYPRAGMDRYSKRLVCPYETARPRSLRDGVPLYAIPGNHDWYDGLTSFMRVFAKDGLIGDWYIPQSRSYFAARLPHRWWILGIDLAFDYYIDSAQLRYFRELRFVSADPGSDEPRINPGDSIILCTGRPGWAEQSIKGDIRVRKGDLGRTALQELEREITDDWECNLRLVLSGDLHHYSRYHDETSGPHRITSGGGGAFLYPTHGLRHDVPWHSIGEPDEALKLQKEYPTQERSRALRKFVPLGPFRNPSFLMLVGAIHVLFATQLRALVTGPKEMAVALNGTTPRNVLGSLAPRPIVQLLGVLLFLFLFAFADAEMQIFRFPAGKLVKGLIHWVIQMAAVTCSIAGAIAITDDVKGWIAFCLMPLAIFILGGLLGGLVMGLYLWVAHLLGAHGNDAFAALRMTGYKNFLRMKIDTDGTLTVYAIGVDKPCTSWSPGTGGAGSEMQPDLPIALQIIEEVPIPRR